MIALLISLGSSISLLANNSIHGPQFDIFKTHIERSFSITDHFSVDIDSNGLIELKLSDQSFAIKAPIKPLTLQQNDHYINLNSNRWTREWKASDLPIFCKAEHHIQKKSGIAFRFRLGSLDYVNALEGK